METSAQKVFDRADIVRDVRLPFIVQVATVCFDYFLDAVSG